MKKQILHIVSLLMAIVVLFVSMGWDVKFHYCTEDHHLSSSFGDAAEACFHCLGHEHEHETQTVPQHGLQFNAKCCCEEFESKIQFTDNYVFSPEKHLIVHFQPFVFTYLNLQELLPKAQQALHQFTARKIPNWRIGRIGLIFFSQLKLNPLVF